MKRAIALMLAIVVAVGLGIGLGFILDSGPSHLDVISETPSGPGPTDEVNGLPVGYARTEEGAVAAAVNFNLLAAGDRVLDRDAMSSAMEALAAPSWRQEAARQADSGYSFLSTTYGRDAEVSAAVVRFRLSDYTPESAVVDLWTVTLLSGELRPNVDEVWGIVTISLTWVEGDWRVTGIESEPGPSPVDLPAEESSLSLEDVLRSFDELESAAKP